MARDQNFYSQLVGGLKIILPLSALALLSTIFLVARGSNSGEAIPYAELAEMARDQGMSNPNLAGVTNDGSAVTITAAELRPEPGRDDFFTILAPRLIIDATDGSRIEVSAGQGEIDTGAKRLSMTDLVRLSTSSGYAMETVGITADVATGQIASLGPLEVLAPFGTLTAAQFTAAASEDGTGQQMVFNGGVHLLYQPQP